MDEIPLQHHVIRRTELDVPGGGSQTRYTIVKTSISSVGLNIGNIGNNLEDYVIRVNYLIKHQLQALKYIYLALFDIHGNTLLNSQQQAHPDMSRLVNDEYFSRCVFTYLADGTIPGQQYILVPGFQTLMEEYIRHSQFQRSVFFGRVQQTSLYANNQVNTAYLNNVQQNFESRVLYTLDFVFKRRNVREWARRQRRTENPGVEDDEDQENTEFNEGAYATNVRQLKAQIGAVNADGVPHLIENVVAAVPAHLRGPMLQEAQELVNDLRLCFAQIQLQPNEFIRADNYFVDAKYTPKRYVNAFYLLSRYAAAQVAPLGHQQEPGEQVDFQSYRSYNWYPTRKSWVPSAVQIDTMILRECVQRLRFENNANLRPAGRQNTQDYKFDIWSLVVNFANDVWWSQGQIQGDEQQPPAWPHDGHWRPFCFNGTIYTDGVSVSILKTTRATNAGGPRRTFVPSVRETTYIHELEQVDRQRLLAIHQDAQSSLVYVDCGRRDLMYCMSSTSTPQNQQTYRYTSSSRRKTLHRRHYRTLRQNVPHEVSQSQQRMSTVNSKTQNLAAYADFLGQQAVEWEILHDWYANATTLGNGETGQPQPLYRKLRFNQYIARQQHDQDLANAIRTAFHDNTVLVMGNWSAPHMRFHEPVRGVGLRGALKKLGLEVYLIDEYRTSKVCPVCLTNTARMGPQRIENPRPWQNSTVKIWGKLICSNCHRTFNRDNMACRNMVIIGDAILNDNPVPDVFTRGGA